MDNLHNILYYVLFYIIGAFPTGLLVAKAYHTDIKSQGSGNVGATNVARTLGKKAGLLTLLGDVIKGALAVFIAKCVSNDITFISGSCFLVTLGHCFSFPKLKGGKGVATAFGSMCMFNIYTALLALVVFILVFYFSRIVSISSILAAISLPIIFKILYPTKSGCIYGILALAFLVIYRHKENIKRLAKGEEKKFSFKK